MQVADEGDEGRRTRDTSPLLLHPSVNMASAVGSSLQQSISTFLLPRCVPFRLYMSQYEKHTSSPPSLFRVVCVIFRDGQCQPVLSDLEAEVTAQLRRAQMLSIGVMSLAKLLQRLHLPEAVYEVLCHARNVLLGAPECQQPQPGKSPTPNAQPIVHAVQHSSRARPLLEALSTEGERCMKHVRRQLQQLLSITMSVLAPELETGHFPAVALDMPALASNQRSSLQVILCWSRLLACVEPTPPHLAYLITFIIPRNCCAQALALSCWQVNLSSQDGEFLQRSRIFETLQRLLTPLPPPAASASLVAAGTLDSGLLSEEVMCMTQETKGEPKEGACAPVFDRAPCIMQSVDVTGDYNVTASGGHDRLRMLSDGNTNTFWETFDGGNTWLTLTPRNVLAPMAEASVLPMAQASAVTESRPYCSALLDNDAYRLDEVHGPIRVFAPAGDPTSLNLAVAVMKWKVFFSTRVQCAPKQI